MALSGSDRRTAGGTGGEASSLRGELARLDLLVLHTADPAGRTAYAAAVDRREELARAGVSDAAELIDRVQAMGFEWGVGDDT